MRKKGSTLTNFEGSKKSLVCQPVTTILGGRIWIKTNRGILDVKKAAQTLRRTVPLSIDDVLHGADTQGLKTLVDESLANGKVKSAFLDEAQAEFGPCVTNPEKIMMLGYNYRKH